MDMTDTAVAQIRADFAAFADANTSIEVSAPLDASAALDVTWTRNDVESTTSVYLGEDGTPSTVGVDGVTSEYRSFFASAPMADLTRLARTILRTLPVPTPFVAPRLRPGHAVGTDAREDVLARLAAPSPVTRLLFLTGDAGAGKSQLLMACARASAERYLTTNVGSLLLYVNAQGRGLARLTEALAAETQDLRANFTYHAVARLARMGLIRVVIDGFDELIGGQGSYQDAFGSLAAFVEELAGHGALVAAARSVYFEQEFLERVDASAALGGALWELQPLEVAPWSEEDVQDYAEQYTRAIDADEGAQAMLLQLLLSEGMQTLRTKPFFVAKVCDLFTSSSLSTVDGVTTAVVQAYVEREVSTKLVDATGSPYLAPQQFTALLNEVAEEMWRQETREMHARGLRELFDIFAEDAGLSEMHRRLLWEQATTRALLRPGRKPQTVAFEHELFFGFFLATYLSSVINGGALRVADAFSRGNVPVDAAQQLFQRFPLAEARLPATLITLESAITRTPRAVELVRQNIGTLIVEMLRVTERVKRLCVRDAIIGVADTAGLSFRDIDFVGVAFRRSDLRGSSFVSCTFADCTFEQVKFSRQTLFTDTQLAIDACSGLLLDDEEAGLRGIYAPADMAALLRELGALPQAADEFRTVDGELLAVLDLLLREFRRGNIISDDRDSYPRLLGHAKWPQVREALRDSGLLVIETRSASGPKKVFYRRTFSPEQLMAGLNPSADVPENFASFWRALEQGVS